MFKIDSTPINQGREKESGINHFLFYVQLGYALNINLLLRAADYLFFLILTITAAKFNPATF